MPVYNRSQFIEETLGYLLGQTFQDFEVILVDDKSTDNSREIIRKVTKGDSRFKLFVNKKNYGSPYVARNRGIEEAKGKYLIFLDDDDIFPKNMLTEYLKVAEKNNTEITIAHFNNYYADTGKMTNQDTYWKYIPKKDLIKVSDMAEYWFIAFLGSPCNKMYRRNLIVKNKIQYPETTREDTTFCIKALLKVKEVGFVHKVLFTHRHGHTQLTNITTSFFYYSMNWWPNFKKFRQDVVKTKNKKLIQSIDNRILDIMMHSFNSAVRSPNVDDITEYFEWIKEIMNYCGLDKCKKSYILPHNQKKYRDAMLIVNDDYIKTMSDYARKVEKLKDEIARIKSLRGATRNFLGAIKRKLLRR